MPDEPMTLSEEALAAIARRNKTDSSGRAWDITRLLATIAFQSARIAALTEALEQCRDIGANGTPPDYQEWLGALARVEKIAGAALSRPASVQGETDAR